MAMMGETVKRVLDILISLFLIVVFCPAGLVIGLLIKMTSPGQVLFKQQRLGQYGEFFFMYKFRTMVQDAEHVGSGLYLEENDSRITSFGKWLRKTSLDELPQLLNVVKGDMSIVGPRPAPLHHIAIYDQRQKARLLLKPGITGWAQIKGRNEIFWPERIEFDLWYLEHQSVWMDLYIMCATVGMVFSRRGIQGNPRRREMDPFNRGF